MSAQEIFNSGSPRRRAEAAPRSSQQVSWSEARIQGVRIIERPVFDDSRGSFSELYNSARLPPGLPGVFVQDNISRSLRGVLRGLHLQATPHGQGKLVTVLRGSAYDVGVDLRPGSPTFGQWQGVVLTGSGGRSVYWPPGLAHGFLATSDEVLLHYKCDAPYAPGAEVTLIWDDPTLGILWPLHSGTRPLLSSKDRGGLELAAALERLSEFERSE